MGRKKIKHKNLNISISVPKYMKQWIESHPDFSSSKFFQIHLQERINND